MNDLDLLGFLLLTLAVYRVTRLLILDTILDGPRDKLRQRLKPKGKALAFTQCPWCVGFYGGLLATGLYWQWPTTTLWLCLPFALSAVAGLIAVNLDL